jgi:hypothetical protein
MHGARKFRVVATAASQDQANGNVAGPEEVEGHEEVVTVCQPVSQRALHVAVSQHGNAVDSQELGCARLKPGKGTPALVASCSDRIRFWQFAGIQGAAARGARVLPDVRFTSLTVAVPTDGASASQLEILERSMQRCFAPTWRDARSLPQGMGVACVADAVPVARLPFPQTVPTPPMFLLGRATAQVPPDGTHAAVLDVAARPSIKTSDRAAAAVWWPGFVGPPCAPCNTHTGTASPQPAFMMIDAPAPVGSDGPKARALAHAGGSSGSADPQPRQCWVGAAFTSKEGAPWGSTASGRDYLLMNATDVAAPLAGRSVASLLTTRLGHARLIYECQWLRGRNDAARSQLSPSEQESKLPESVCCSTATWEAAASDSQKPYDRAIVPLERIPILLRSSACSVVGVTPLENK